MGNVKLLIMLRDPVERAFSHWKMVEARGMYGNTPRYFHAIVMEETTHIRYILNKLNTTRLSLMTNDFQSTNKKNLKELLYENLYEEFEKLHLREYVFRGLYGMMLEQWKRVFPAEQIYIINSEQFFNNMEVELDEVVKFLNLKDRAVDWKKIVNEYASQYQHKYIPNEKGLNSQIKILPETKLLLNE